VGTGGCSGRYRIDLVKCGVVPLIRKGPLVAGRLSSQSLPPGAWMPVYPAAARDATGSCASPGCWCRDRVPCYPPDLTDAQRAVLEPRARQVMAELTVAAGRPMVHDLRQCATRSPAW
jgi:hypothetical protein